MGEILVKNSRRKIGLWAGAGFAFLVLAVVLLVAAASDSGSGGEQGGSAPSTSWYTTQPQQSVTASAPGEPSEEPTDEPTAPAGPLPVVTQTVISVSPGGGDGGGGNDVVASIGTLLSGLAAVGTLLHAVQLSRQNRRPDPESEPTPAPPS
ncbi:hypothetical protein [Streptomyces hyaluromycini]|uniref:hypothetical protein n=1 Tax=Streptomyces hyaluromycini TaxID=1377993 RepID=UPI0011AEA29F|nr:hypothetical protein [Streptomyces hyaluromycini]